MIIQILAQYDSHSGPRATGDHMIKFTVQKENIGNLFSHLEQLEKSPYVILDIQTIENKNEADQILKKNNDMIHTQLNKKIHSMIDQWAKISEVNSDVLKATVKDSLKKSNKITNSLIELKVEDQKELIKILEGKINEASN